MGDMMGHVTNTNFMCDLCFVVRCGKLNPTKHPQLGMVYLEVP